MGCITSRQCEAHLQPTTPGLLGWGFFTRMQASLRRSACTYKPHNATSTTLVLMQFTTSKRVLDAFQTGTSCPSYTGYGSTQGCSPEADVGMTPCLVSEIRTWLVGVGVFHNGAGSSPQVSVHVQVPPAQVALDQELVLLRVSASHHQQVLGGHEPVEALKPEGLSGRHRDHHLLGLHMYTRHHHSSFSIVSHIFFHRVLAHGHRHHHQAAHTGAELINIVHRVVSHQGSATAAMHLPLAGRRWGSSSLEGRRGASGASLLASADTILWLVACPAS